MSAVPGERESGAVTERTTEPCAKATLETGNSRNPPVTTTLDHLVIAAATLAQGVAWCEATLGATPGPGGSHALFGTHNRLLKIADVNWPDAYLEIIAIDPGAPAPARPRWFGLDEPALQSQLDAAGPRLIHAVARSTRLEMHRRELIAVGCHPGDPVSASRETAQGRLSWQILVPADGRPDCDGALPTLIEWLGAHPTAHMPDSALTLCTLSLCGVPDSARDVLQLRGVDFRAGRGPALQATLATPRGRIAI